MTKAIIQEKLAKLNEILTQAKEQTEEDFENENLIGIALSVCTSVGMQIHKDELGLLELLETAFVSGWTLARTHYNDENEELEELLDDFPSQEELAKTLTEELSVYFRDQQELEELLAQTEGKGKHIL